MNDILGTVKGLVGQNLTIEGRQGIATRYNDPQRNWTWEAAIPATLIKKIQTFSSNLSINSLQNLGGVTDKLLSEEDLIIKCREATIPSKTFTDISTSYYGQKRKFPGRVEFSNLLVLQYEETERQTIKKFIDLWQNIILNSEFKNQDSLAGSSIFDKQDFMTEINLIMYAYSGIQLDKSIVFYNCWPKEISEVPLSYTSNSDLVRYTINFSFDYWELVQNNIKQLGMNVVNNTLNAGASALEQKLF